MRADGVARDSLFVEHQAETWAVGDAHAALPVDDERLGEHLVARCRRPAAGRIVWKFQERSVGDGSGKVKVGHEPDAVAPCMRRHLDPRDLGERRYLPHLADAFRQ